MLKEREHMKKNKKAKVGKMNSLRSITNDKPKSRHQRISGTRENAKLTWDDISQNFRKGSRYVVVDSPGNADLVGKEALVVEGKKKNCNTVKVEIEGSIYKIHFSYLRDIISEEIRAAIRQSWKQPER
jgi:hypothetical protein